MFVKKFEAQSLEQALTQIKEQFGPGALVLSTEQKRGGLFQRPYVEVTAAVTESETNVRHSFTSADVTTKQSSPSVTYQRESMGSQRPIANKRPQENASTRYVDIDSHEIVANRKKSPHPFEADWLELGFRPESSKELATRLVVDFAAEDLRNPQFLSRAKSRLLTEAVRMMYPDSFDTYRRWVVTGGPGVGKTSMCVKLAIYLKRLGKQVVLSSIDSKKLLGQKELERYAKQIDVPYLPPEATLRDNRLVIFDTSAWDSSLPLKEAADEVRYDAALAVVDSRERFTEANLFLRKLHRTYQVKALAFSRVDLSETRGFIFDLLRAQKLPLLGISRGSSFKVPFHFFEPTAFSNYIMGRECE